MTRQEKKEELIGLFLNGAITIGELIDECFEFGQQHPRWISVEDELPRCYIPYNNWDGTPSDVLESEKVIALLSDGTICIATFNQNLDVDTDKPTGSPYWFDEGHPEDGDRIRGEVTHWMPLPQPLAKLSNLERIRKEANNDEN